MGIQIRQIKIKDVRNDPRWLILCQANADDVRNDLDYAQVNPRWDVYSELEFQDSLFGLGVYDDHIGIVGYSINMMTQHLHYGTKFCMNDAVFLLPEFRTGMNGIRLITETESKAKELGCALMNWHVKPGTPLAQLLMRRKYSERDIILEKVL